MRRSRVYKIQLMLRLALAFSFGYAAVRAYLNPSDWIGYVPYWVESFGLTRERFLSAFGAFEIAMALVLLANFKSRWLGLVSAAMLFSIAIGAGPGALDSTFRDVGLGLAGLALFYTKED